MPIYEYECDKCSHRFEQIVRIGAEAPPCPSCASGEVHKRISASGFILKGGGWYKDHYGLKSGGSSTAGSGDAGGSSASSSGSESPSSTTATTSTSTSTSTATTTTGTTTAAAK